MLDCFYFQIIEVMEGAGVYWYSHQQAYCNAFNKATLYINVATDMFLQRRLLRYLALRETTKKTKMELAISH